MEQWVISQFEMHRSSLWSSSLKGKEQERLRGSVTSLKPFHPVLRLGH